MLLREKWNTLANKLVDMLIFDLNQICPQICGDKEL